MSPMSLTIPGAWPTRRSVILGAATVSWIDPIMLLARWLPEADWEGDPGRRIARSTLQGARRYRFANYLEVSLEMDGSRIIRKEFTAGSGLYANRSYEGIPSEPFPIERTSTEAHGTLTFRQVVGCRTWSPEAVGSCSAVRAVRGERAWDRCLDQARTVCGQPSGFLDDATIDAMRRCLGGRPLEHHPTEAFQRALGRRAAERTLVFPPIWTELELTIPIDGEIRLPRARMLRHSLFPSINVYQQDPADPDAFAMIQSHDGFPHFDRWAAHGWGPLLTRPGASGPVEGNPWGKIHP